MDLNSLIMDRRDLAVNNEYIYVIVLIFDPNQQFSKVK